MTTKRQSKHRFEQLNRLVDVVLPSIPAGKSSHRTVLLVAFRHAGATGGFVMSKARIAKSAGIDERQVRRIMIDLECWGILKRSPQGDRGQVRAYKITYQPYKERDDMEDRLG